MYYVQRGWRNAVGATSVTATRLAIGASERSQQSCSFKEDGYTRYVAIQALGAVAYSWVYNAVQFCAKNTLKSRTICKQALKNRVN